MVLSKLRIFTVTSDTSSTMPLTSYLGIVIQSPGLTILLAESWMPATSPSSVSLKIKANTVATAPSPAIRLRGDCPKAYDTPATRPMAMTVSFRNCMMPTR